MEFARSFLLCLLIALAPVLALNIYIEFSGDIAARWLVVRYGFLMLGWFMVFTILGVVKGVKKSRLNEHQQRDP